MLLAWHKYGGGKELLDKLYASIGGNVVSFLYGPMATQPLGWFKKPITKAEDFKGLKFRTNGLAIDLFTAMGAAVNALPGGEIVPAMDRGLLDGAEFNNATSDRILGFPDVSKVCMLQSYHQSAETFEITFNKPKYDALPAKMKSIIAYAVEAASADMSWKAIDRYSKDYIELQTKDKVKFYKTPDAVLQVQLKLWDAILEKKSAENPLFKEIVESQKAFAERAVKWDQDTYVSRRMAVSHFFGAKAAEPKKARRSRSSSSRPSGQRPGWLIRFERHAHAKAAPDDRQDQHLRRPGVLLADRRAHAHDHLGGLLALRAGPPALVGVRRDDHHVRHAVHDGRRLHAGEVGARPRRRPVRLLRSRARRRRST